MPQAPIAILDLGTAKIAAVVCEERGGWLRFSGQGEAPSRGIRKGQVVDLEEAARAVAEATARAESAAGVPLERVFLNLTSAQIASVASQASVALASRSREITREDARQALELARGVPLPADREILHVLPQQFVLDHQAGVRDPVGMLASRLEARILILTVAAGAKQNLVLAANRAGLEVEELVFAPLAAAEILLHAEERETGAAVIDIGAGSTGLIAFLHGTACHAAAIPVGGDHFTNDLAIAFNTPPAEAERIKRGFGLATAASVKDGTAVEVPSLGDRPTRMLPQRRICECLEFRARELAQLLRAELARAGLLRALGAGIFLAGGGARLAGLPELLESELGFPVRLASPELVEAMPASLAQPEYAFAVGATYYAHRVRSHYRPRPTWRERWAERWREWAGG